MAKQSTTIFGLQLMSEISTGNGPEFKISRSGRERFMRSIGLRDRGGIVFYKGTQLVIPSQHEVARNPKS